MKHNLSAQLFSVSVFAFAVTLLFSFGGLATEVVPPPPSSLPQAAIIPTSPTPAVSQTPPAASEVPAVGANSAQDLEQKQAVLTCQNAASTNIHPDVAAVISEMGRVSATAGTLTPDPRVGLVSGCTSAINKIEAAVGKCAHSAHTASSICIESMSPVLQGAMPMLSLGLSAMQMMSASDACKKQSELLTIASDALAAYNTACAATKMMCNGSCKAADAAVAVADKACSAFASSAKATSDGHSDNALCDKSCNHYMLNLVAGGLGLGQMIASMKKSSACNKATTQATTVGPPTLNCGAGSANAGSAACLCQANPSSCANTTGNTNVAVTGINASPTAASNPGNSSGGIAGGSGAGSGSGTSASGAGNSANNSPTIAGTSPPPATSGISAKETGAKLNYDPAAFGADGAASSSYGGAGSTASTSSASSGGSGPNLSAYARSPASEISGKAGKSNWDKIDNAYFNLSPNLIK